jgi:hypothetical protein
LSQTRLRKEEAGKEKGKEGKEGTQETGKENEKDETERKNEER